MRFCYGALFDMDGVVVDNAKYHMLAFEEWCRESGIGFDREHFKKHLFGRQTHDIFASLTGRELPPDELTAEAEHKEQLYRKIYDGHVQPVEGIVEFLKDLKANGFGTALATSGPPENVSFILNALGIDGIFDVIITNRDVTEGKPDPRIFVLAAERLGLPPQRCIVFEDSTAGAQAAVASGATLVGVATAHARLEGAARMIANFKEITAAESAELLSFAYC